MKSRTRPHRLRTLGVTMLLSLGLVVPLAAPSAADPLPPDTAGEDWLDPAPSDEQPTDAGSFGAAAIAGTGMPCPGYNGLQSLNPVSNVMAAKFTIPGVPTTTVGSGSDINWRMERAGNPSWHMWLHTLKWTGALIQSYAATGDRTHLNRASAIAQDWVANNDVARPYRYDLMETVAGRTHTLLCLDRFVDARWLDQALLGHAQQLVGFYSGAHNHGIDQSIGLLGVGCNLNRKDHADLAVSRMAQATSVMVDSQGVTNEQSVGYAAYSYNRLNALELAIVACGRTPPSVMDRVALMPQFVAHATRPDGTTVAIGDTVTGRVLNWPGTATEFFATRGEAGTPPAQRVRTYAAGYTFGRSGWGGSRPWDQEMHYSLRHGVGRALHGHNDRTSMTFFARNREVLIDPGHNGYDPGPFRNFLVSPEAHNVLTVRNAAFNPSATTRMTRSLHGPRADWFELVDNAFAGSTRVRRVAMLRGPDAVLVLDTASSTTPRGFTQHWHLPGTMTATVTGRGTATAVEPDGERTTLLQIPLPGQVLPRGSTQLVRGQHAPVQGWFSPAVYEIEPAPVITMSRAGTSTAMLTLIAPVRGNGQVSASTRSVGASTFIDLNIGGVKTTVKMARDGVMTR
ncbi:heparinase II/III domain-containing protein [Aquipuribacter sp. MA13-6]|uniref:heparinase II/III domain-containing protein n=1 Tax=unclassified Aquipuribacter TaxID=2635084 RepID=UPI003EEF4D57